jgi:hypothetical protein
MKRVGAPRSLGRYFPYRLTQPPAKPTGELAVIRLLPDGIVESWCCYSDQWIPGHFAFLGNLDQASEMANLLGGYVLFSTFPAPVNPLVEDAAE